MTWSLQRMRKPLSGGHTSTFGRRKKTCYQETESKVYWKSSTLGSLISHLCQTSARQHCGPDLMVLRFFLKVKWEKGVLWLVPSWIVKNSSWPSGCWVSDMVEVISSRWWHRLFSTSQIPSEEELATIYTQDTTVKIPEPRGEVRQPSGQQRLRRAVSEG